MEKFTELVIMTGAAFLALELLGIFLDLIKEILKKRKKQRREERRLHQQRDITKYFKS